MKPVVTDNVDERRYEAHVDDVLAGHADYQRTIDLVILTHTEVDPAFKGQGVGGALARSALADVRRQGLMVLPICPFMKSWIGDHEEYADLMYGPPASTVTD
jgi:uncharacterized protein